MPGLPRFLMFYEATKKVQEEVRPQFGASCFRTGMGQHPIEPAILQQR
jgi:hypothetical protein